MTRTTHLFLPALLLLFLCIPPALAQDTGVDRQIATWTETLSKIEKQIKPGNLSDDQITKLRDQLGGIQNSARELLLELTPELEQLVEQQKKLGPAPAEMSDAVAKARAEQKARLDKQQSLVDGVKLVQLQSGKLDAAASEIQRSRFLNRLLDRSGSPLNPSLWIDGIPHLADIPDRMKFLIAGWTGDDAAKPGGGRYLFLVLSIVFGVFIALPLRRWLKIRLRSSMPEEAAGSSIRVRIAVASALVDVTLPILAIILIYYCLHTVGLLTLRVERFVQILIVALLWMIAIRGAARSILAPRIARWRLMEIDDAAAWRAYRIIAAIAYIYAFDVFFTGISDLFFLATPLRMIVTAVSSLSIALLIAMLLRPRLIAGNEAADTGTQDQYFTWLGYVYRPLWLLVALIAVTTLLGYLALGHFLVREIVQTGLLVVLLYLVHILADEFLHTKLTPDERAAQFAGLKSRFFGQILARFGPAIAACIDFILFIIALPLLLLQWGLSVEDLRSWLSVAFFGVEFGNVRISLSSILVALAVLLAGFMITHLVQRWLDVRLLGKTKLDVGVRTSIRTGLGYIGTLITIVIAMTYAGVDFTDIAIIAGALSVGIGFGLQGIINNFVSGLILLAERPFKAGDWIVVGDQEGYVKEVNVRSTEVVTFDRATLTVPNSELITKTVTNWTHKGTLGRVIVGVGVSYASDPNQVRDVLLACAEGHREIVKNPEPKVIFRNFGDSALDFELRAFVIDVDRRLTVGSDLRFEIFQKLKDANIEIPFPQRDVHITQVPPDA